MLVGGSTRLLGVIGHPISHSLSPRMHNAAFSAGSSAGNLKDRPMEYIYVPLEVSSEELPAAVAGLRAANFVGFNVTMPHKAAILPLLDELDETSRVAGAVNTVDLQSERARGFNTDGSGFVEACGEAGADVAGRRALILGAGGAAAAIAFALWKAGVSSLAIVNRTPGRAEDLRRRLLETGAGMEVRVYQQKDLAEAAEKAEILVNSTYLGMREQDPLPLPDPVIGGGRVICDAVYRAGTETPLIKLARERGALTVPGGRMLLYQGVAAQRIWTGREPDIRAMSAAIR